MKTLALIIFTKRFGCHWIHPFPRMCVVKICAIIALEVFVTNRNFFVSFLTFTVDTFFLLSCLTVKVREQKSPQINNFSLRQNKTRKKCHNCIESKRKSFHRRTANIPMRDETKIDIEREENFILAFAACRDERRKSWIQTKFELFLFNLARIVVGSGGGKGERGLLFTVDWNLEWGWGWRKLVLCMLFHRTYNQYYFNYFVEFSFTVLLLKKFCFYIFFYISFPRFCGVFNFPLFIRTTTKRSGLAFHSHSLCQSRSFNRKKMVSTKISFHFTKSCCAGFLFFYDWQCHILAKALHWQCNSCCSIIASTTTKLSRISATKSISNAPTRCRMQAAKIVSVFKLNFNLFFPPESLLPRPLTQLNFDF